MKALPGVLIVCLLFSGSAPAVSAQVRVDSELFSLFSVKDTLDRDYAAPLKAVQNDLSTMVSLGFLFYKTFISSQDTPSCVFTPSCSEYALRSIQQKGLVLGWLSAFDRLSRCHGLVGHQHYPFDEEKMRFYDPVR